MSASGPSGPLVSLLLLSIPNYSCCCCSVFLTIHVADAQESWLFMLLLLSIPNYSCCYFSVFQTIHVAVSQYS